MLGAVVRPRHPLTVTYWGSRISLTPRHRAVVVSERIGAVVSGTDMYPTGRIRVCFPDIRSHDRPICMTDDKPDTWVVERPGPVGDLLAAFEACLMANELLAAMQLILEVP